MKPVFLAFSAALAILAACSEIKPEDFQEDKKLFEHAEKLFEDGSFTESINFYESLRNRFPQSPYAAPATLRIADAYYEKQEFLEAEVSYQNFRSLYPTNAKMPYAAYRLGMCHVKQIPSGQGRDQTHTKRAITYFEELLSRWPDGEFSKDAREQIAKCKRKLLEYEMYVVNFYFRQDQHEAALLRLHSILEGAQNDEMKAEASYKLGYAYHRAHKDDEARKFLDRAASLKGESKYPQKAKELLKEIGPK